MRTVRDVGFGSDGVALGTGVGRGVSWSLLCGGFLLMLGALGLWVSVNGDGSA